MDVIAVMAVVVAIYVALSLFGIFVCSLVILVKLFFKHVVGLDEDEDC
jgi:hypothetical protein